MRLTNPYKLHGFTLLETIIAMIIAAIAITMFYWVFTFINQQFVSYTQERQKMTSMLLFKKALLKDINQCNYIYTPDNGTVYWFIYADDTVVYELYPAINIYKSGIADSTGITTKYIRAEYVQMIRGNKLVKSIHLSTMLPVEIKKISFTKYYSSEQLMNAPM